MINGLPAWSKERLKQMNGNRLSSKKFFWTGREPCQGASHPLPLPWVSPLCWAPPRRRSSTQVSENAIMFPCTEGPQPRKMDNCAVLSFLVLLKPNVQGYVAYETVAGPTVCVSGIFPSKHHWKKIRFSHISCGVNSLWPGTPVSQIQPVTTKISFQNYIWAKQVRTFLLSLLIQNSSTAINILFAFYFSL